MNDIFFHLIAALGLLFILKDSTILATPRDFLKSLHPLINELLSCAQCLGFWTGIVYSVAYFAFYGFSVVSLFWIPCFGFAISITGLVLNLVLDYLDESVFKMQNTDKI